MNKLFLAMVITTATVFLVWLLVQYANQQMVPVVPPDPLFKEVSASIEDRIENLLSYMTLAEKIGQMTLVEKNSIITERDIADYHLGALLSGAGSQPEQNTPEDWKKMIDGYQAMAEESRLGIPLLYGVDAIHGHAHVQTATVFPHALGLGATKDAELVYKVAKATAAELRATGVNWSYSPTLDQPQDIRWGRVYEAFSDDPALVTELGVAYVKGLQTHSDLFKDNLFVLATPKHYLGLGSMQWDTSLNKNFKIDQGVTLADKELLYAKHLPPFAAVVEAGALSIMVGLNTWGEQRMVLQKELLTDVLKGELGFKGFLVSDWYGVHEGRRNTFWATVQAVNAGVDMVMLPFDYHTFARHLTWANRLGLVSNERIDDAVGRILYAKFALGLFNTNDESSALVSIPNVDHQVLAREAVAKTLVLLKNEDNLLPLSPNISSILVAGSAADNIGRQVGAWTIEWQGIDGNWLPGATSILSGIKSRVSQRTLIQYDVLGNFATSEIKAPVGIAVVGENSYAEGWGDTEQLVLSDEDLQAIANLKASANQVLVIIVSGRPLFIADEIDSFAGLVAAWLPGGEGAGVSDVLFGDKPFVGTLPIPWPSQIEQLPIGYDDETADGTQLLFPRYFGLSL